MLMFLYGGYTVIIGVHRGIISSMENQMGKQLDDEMDNQTETAGVWGHLGMN